MAAARAIKQATCEYMLELALFEALAPEHRAFDKGPKRLLAGPTETH
jgi:hypothetical protein